MSSDAVKLLLTLVIGYLLGSISTGVIASISSRLRSISPLSSYTWLSHRAVHDNFRVLIGWCIVLSYCARIACNLALIETICLFWYFCTSRNHHI